MSNLLGFVESEAFITPDGRFRYMLRRRWAIGDDLLVFLMLNPSKADAKKNDPTIRRDIGFAKLWKHPGLAVVNMYGLRSTDPDELLVDLEGAVGLANDAWISNQCTGRRVVCAWGSHAAATQKRINQVMKILRNHCAREIVCLGLTKGGMPKHPLYVPANTTPISYE